MTLKGQHHIYLHHFKTALDFFFCIFTSIFHPFLVITCSKSFKLGDLYANIYYIYMQITVFI